MPIFPEINVKALWRPQSIPELDSQMISLGGQPTFAGVNVDENSALSYTGVYSCVRVRGEGLAMLSLHLYRKKGKGAEKATDRPLYYMVHDAPNAEMSSTTWRKTMSAHYDLWGNAYCWIDWEQTGRNAGQVRQLYPLKPERVRPYRDSETNRLKYEYTRRNAGGVDEKITHDMNEVLHLRGIAHDGIVGYSPITLMRQAVGLGLATEEFGSRFFGSGAHVGGVVNYPQSVDQEQVDAIRPKLKEDYAGLHKSHSLMVLAAGGEYTPISMPLEDAQFLSTRQFQLQEIARMYRVPLHLIQDMHGATFSNIEQQMREFMMVTMTPICKEWEQELNMKLLTESERAAGYYFEFDLNSFMRGDTVARGNFYKLMRECGAYSPNMILEKENENPREDPGGDKFWDEGPSGQGQSAKTQASLRPVLDEAMSRIARREQQDILAEAQKRAKKDDSTGFANWLDAFLVDHEAFCAHILQPYYAALGSPDEAYSAARARVNALKAALFGAKWDDIENMKRTLEGVTI